ncbi:hypothetical protein [Pleionea litopenaei]|uniref:Uncharacterized protein n=1 Tax=Pleionea litopenaei TaxID=3070815 RepID=A0AA51RWS0_9GAMM|nr:hypothetical protein [Pleionea sp. HL-JVS1]WMS88924.1 hypothetical protein Q9312_08405 [Pleionea sp. HL-JVS1]
MEYGDVKLWAIQLDDKPNDVLTMGYFPPNDVVPKKLEFLSRGDGVNRIDENEEIN